MFSNEEVTLSLHKETLKGICKDYIIKLNREERQIENIIPITFDVVSKLVEHLHLKDKTVKARLVAKVCYIRQTTDEEVNVFHPSYKNEIIIDVEDFFTSHMLKIAQRIGDFNQRGSNLLIKNIPEIHLHVTCINKQA